MHLNQARFDWASLKIFGDRVILLFGDKLNTAYFEPLDTQRFK
jgi:hypothetical protein